MRNARGVLATGLAAVALTGVAAGCGGGTRQDADEKSATYTVEVTKAQFPARQHLAEGARMSIVVRNRSRATIPDVGVTLGDEQGQEAFTMRSEQAGLADPNRPVWIVDRGPLRNAGPDYNPEGGSTAYVNTWALGPLRPGASRRFTWKVTPIVAGSHTVKYRVNAGLDGKAKAQLASGDAPEGTFNVDVDEKPAQAHVDPETGAVVREGESSEK
jgi:hypothetical protein